MVFSESDDSFVFLLIKLSGVTSFPFLLLVCINLNVSIIKQCIGNVIKQVINNLVTVTILKVFFEMI